MTEKEKEQKSSLDSMTFESGPPPELGELVYEKSFPSNAALVTPAVVRATDFLVNRALIDKKRRNKVGVCFEEALMNAVVHGNGEDFSKMADLRVYCEGNTIHARVDDSGEGFDRNAIRDPGDEESLWGESGRGFCMILLYADAVRCYRSGATLVMSFGQDGGAVTE